MRILRVLLITTLSVAAATIAVPGAQADTATVPNSAPAGGSYVPVAPTRLLDTRTAGGPITTVTVAAGGRAGIPTSGVEAVSVNLTVVDPAASGHGSGSRADRSPQGTALINFSAGRVIAEAAVIGTDSAGAFTIYLSTPAQLLIDISGYFTAPDQATTAGRLVPITPARAYDTRSVRSPLLAGHPRAIQLTGTHGLPPTGVQSVVVNLTAVAPRRSGYLTAWSNGVRPTVSAVNFAAGETRANRALVQPDSAGRIQVYSSADTDAIVDVSGYFADSANGGYYVPLDPARRAADSRREFSATGALGAHRGSSYVGTAGDGFAPGAASISAPIAVVTTVTTVPTAAYPGSGYLTVKAAGAPASGTSDLNFARGLTTGNLAVVGLRQTSSVELAAASTGDVNYIVDLVGYFAKPLPATTPPGIWTVPEQTGPVPESVNELTGATALAGRNDSGMALRRDHTVWVWDGSGEAPRNVAGRTYIGTAPYQKTGLPDIVAVAAGEISEYALDSQGRVWAWGGNGSGELGDGTTTNSSTPEQVVGLPRVVRVFARTYGAYAVSEDGTVWGWGDNASGTLGDGSTQTRLSPVIVGGLHDPVSIAGDRIETQAVLADGSVQQWGDVLDGTTRTVVPSPRPRAGVCSARSVVAGEYNHLELLCADGTVDGLPGLDHIVALTIINNRNLVAAVRDDGTVWDGGRRPAGVVWYHVPGLTGITAIASTLYRGTIATTGA